MERDVVARMTVRARRPPLFHPEAMPMNQHKHRTNFDQGYASSHIAAKLHASFLEWSSCPAVPTAKAIDDRSAGTSCLQSPTVLKCNAWNSYILKPQVNMSTLYRYSHPTYSEPAYVITLGCSSTSALSQRRALVRRARASVQAQHPNPPQDTPPQPPIYHP